MPSNLATKYAIKKKTKISIVCYAIMSGHLLLKLLKPDCFVTEVVIG